MEMKIWEPSIKENIKGNIFIVHGMGEYSKRYEEVGKYLSDNGYRVAMIDHKGHGKNIKNKDQLGLVKDNFKSSLEEISQAIEDLRELSKGKPLFILGHSMGSFMTQRLLELGIKNNGIILSGSSRPQKVAIEFIYKFISLRLKVGNKRDILLDKMVFGLYNKKFSKSSKFNWLSRDQKSVAEYEKDELCGAIPYTSYFRGLFYLIKKSLQIGDKQNFTKTPMYIFSGSDDPVGEYAKGTKRLYEFYKKLGYKNLKLKIYSKGRHEMLNEINKEEVYRDFLTWLGKQN